LIKKEKPTLFGTFAKRPGTVPVFLFAKEPNRQPCKRKLKIPQPHKKLNRTYKFAA